MTPEEKIGKEIKAKMSPEDIERLRPCTDEREAQKMLEDARVKIPLDMLDAVSGGVSDANVVYDKLLMILRDTPGNIDRIYRD